MKYVNLVSICIALALALGGCATGFDEKHHLPPVDQVIPATPPAPIIKSGDDARIALVKTKNHDSIVVRRLDEARGNYSLVVKSFEEAGDTSFFPFK